MNSRCQSRLWENNNLRTDRNLRAEGNLQTQVSSFRLSLSHSHSINISYCK